MRLRSYLFLFAFAGLSSLSYAQDGNFDEIAALNTRPRLTKGNMAKTYIKEGKALLEQKKYKQALEKFNSALVEDPSNFELNYLIGQAAYYSGNYTEAVYAYQRALSLNPSFGQARLELARAHQAKGEWEDSRKALERAQADPNVPQGVREQAERLLAEMGKERRMTLAGSITVGQAWESNANKDPGEIPLISGGLPVTLNGVEQTKEPSKKSDTPQSYSLYIIHGYPLEKRGMVWRSTLSSGGSFYHKAKSNTINSAKVTTGLEYAVGPHLWNFNGSLSTLYTAKILSREGFSGAIRYNYQIRSGWSARGSLSAGRRNHSAAENEFLHKKRGSFSSLSLGTTYFMNAKNVLSGDLSYLNDSSPTAVEQEAIPPRADTRFRRYDASAALTHILNSKWTTNGRLSLYRATYRNVNEQYQKKRKDTSWLVRVGLVRKWNQFFSGEIAASHRKLNSNIDLYSYNNNILEVQVTSVF